MPNPPANQEVRDEDGNLLGWLTIFNPGNHLRLAVQEDDDVETRLSRRPSGPPDLHGTVEIHRAPFRSSPWRATPEIAEHLRGAGHHFKAAVPLSRDDCKAIAWALERDFADEDSRRTLRRFLDAARSAQVELDL